MNAIQQTDGHSIRSKIIHKLRNIFYTVDRLRIRSMVFSTILLVLIFSSCHEKSNGQNTSLSKDQRSEADSINKPKIDIKVNRHFDEKGNMIGFDSTYSSYYSNVQGDTAGMDTLFKKFDSYFKHNHSSVFDREFNDLFFRDSLLYPDFFHKDFFMKRYELNDKYLRDMMQRMDSVKNEFYRNWADKKGNVKES